MIGYIVKSIFVTDKAQKKLYASFIVKQSRVSDKLHSFYHNLRDYTSSFNNINYITIDNVKEKSINLCGYIAEFYKQLFRGYIDDYDISVCIKIIKSPSFDEDYMDWEMETFARSINTQQGRKNIDFQPVKISENTDFQVIISPDYKDELFSFTDMRTIKEDFPKTYNNLQYKNSRGDDFINLYRSTIVVPIKINGKFVRRDLRNKMKKPDEKNLILGFLCIDSMKTFTTQEEIDIFSLGIEYAKSLGDSLYLFFEKLLTS